MSSQLVWLATSKVWRRIFEPWTLTRAPMTSRGREKRCGHGERPRWHFVAMMDRRSETVKRQERGDAQDREPV